MSIGTYKNKIEQLEFENKVLKKQFMILFQKN